MTHEVQGRMLLREWFAWWEAIDSMEAERQIADYNTLLIGNPGWEGLDRQQRVERLYQQAYGDMVAKASQAPTSTNGHTANAHTDDVHMQMRKAYAMLVNAFGSAVIPRGPSLN